MGYYRMVNHRKMHDHAARPSSRSLPAGSGSPQNTRRVTRGTLRVYSPERGNVAVVAIGLVVAGALLVLVASSVLGDARRLYAELGVAGLALLLIVPLLVIVFGDDRPDRR